MTKKTINPNEFVRSYTPISGSYAERGAKFLYDAMQAIPLRFIDFGVCAKISLGLSRVPGADHEDMKRFKSIQKGIDNQLMKLGYVLVSDRVDGLRCSVDDEDKLKTRHRKSRRRVKLAADTLKKVDSLVDVGKVKDPELKKELLASRRSMKLLDDALSGLPQLSEGDKKR